MKIGFASADWSHSVTDENGFPVWGGSGWARLGQYADLMSHEVVSGMLIGDPTKGLIGVREYNPKKNALGGWIPWSWEGGTDHLDCDIVVVQRIMYHEAWLAIEAAVMNGKIVVSDIDDWYWGLSTQNAAWLASHPKVNPVDNLNNYKMTLARSSHVMVSTPYLADRVKPFIKAPIEVLPNTVDFSRFVPRIQSEEPTIGWAGSTSHRSGDLEVLRGIASQMIRDGFKMHHVGSVDGARSFAEQVGVDKGQVSTSPLVAPDEYPAALEFDIGLVPLTDVPFNNAKSNIKSLEYAAKGIPFVASNVGEYSRMHDQYGVGRMVRKPKDWMTHVRALRQPEVRIEEAARNREALDEFDIRFGAKRLEDYLNSLI